MLTWKGREGTSWKCSIVDVGMCVLWGEGTCLYTSVKIRQTVSLRFVYFNGYILPQ